MPEYLNFLTAGWYIAPAALGLLLATLPLRRTSSKVRWWEWPGLAAPLAVWSAIWAIPAVTDGRKSLANLSEPLYLGLTVGCLALLFRWLGARWLQPTTVRLGFMLAGCVAAMLIALWFPMLAE
jgi:hypothetical protein